MAWEIVTRVELDEDRLVVCVGRRDLPDLVIEPVYEGAGVYALAEAITLAQKAAKERPP